MLAKTDWLESARAIGVLSAVLLAPLLLGLRRGHAPLGRWLLAPLVSIAGSSVLVGLSHALTPTLRVTFTTTQRALVDGLTLAALLAAAYGAGRVLARTPGAAAHLRGTQLVPEPPHATPGRAPHAITLAGVPIPVPDETKHFKFIGTTGAGKSTAIREVLRTALRRGDRAIIADPDAGYLARFYDPYRGDELFNPFDARSVQWDLYGELQEPYDIEQLARSLIPEGADAGGREWRAYARTFLAALLKRAHDAGERDIGRLWHHLAEASSDELRPLVAGTPAQPFLDTENARMFGSLRSVATHALTGIEYVAQHRGGLPLSVREWIRGPGTRSRVLFLPYTASQIASLRSIIASWLRLAIFEAMSQGERDQRLWFVIDELDALGAIDGLKDALARLRKFGGRCVIGFQSIGQVSALYGHGESQTIIENCGNTLILRCSASEGGGTAQFASHLIGQREVLRRHESLSVSRDLKLFSSRRHRSRTVSAQPAMEWAVLPAEIEQLPDLSGYLKLASRPQWLNVRVR